MTSEGVVGEGSSCMGKGEVSPRRKPSRVRIAPLNQEAERSCRRSNIRVSPYLCSTKLSGSPLFQVPVAILCRGGGRQTSLQRAQLIEKGLHIFLLRELHEPGFQRSHLV